MKPSRKTTLMLAGLFLLPLGACADRDNETADDARAQTQRTEQQTQQAEQTQAQTTTDESQSDASYGDPAQAGGINGSGRSSNFDDIEAHIRLETHYAMSDELSALQIDTDVRDGTAYLGGEVESAAERELAEQAAFNIEGIRSVRNDIRVIGDTEQATIAERLASTADDARITATVKARLLASENTAGLEINVDTDEQVVTLMGNVNDDTERELAELIAANTSGVKDVRNELAVKDD
ncbi:BON domain-containing protein [Wenzhouxiangella sp. XN24]|uniref:BON domain-containing protein n=1 Tax=Wenzhouxiangella sp. XN24 TaxID=2713569 RepID=UPI0013EAECF2|nr:BON domain-containing protein [Wenzhouxiangella sp. XN24]NGX15023.1 BON domain-containing protein [Wenzhouxiangella sp. XN24]